MVEENNTDEHLTYLWISKQITMESYFFRQGAERMNIKTYSKKIA